jgi:hypothetical protein
MFVSVIGEILAIGPFADRKTAEAEAARLFPGKPSTVFMLMEGQGTRAPMSESAARLTGRSDQSASIPSSTELGLDLPSQRVPQHAADPLRAAMRDWIKGHSDELRFFRNTPHANDGSVSRFLHGAVNRPRARVYDAMREVLIARQAELARFDMCVDCPPHTTTPERSSLPNKKTEVAQLSLGPALLDVAVSRGISRKPEVIAEVIGLDVEIIECALRGDELEEDSAARILNWLTA